MNDIQELINIAGMTAEAIKNGKFVWVVRGKDCKNNNQCSIQFKFANADNPGDWFCADGKRKEGW